MAEIETWKFIGSEVEFVMLEDAARYLHCLKSTLWQYISVGLLSAVEIESRWFIEWSSLQAVAAKRGQKSRSG
jgi:hypothetical protein